MEENKNTVKKEAIKPEKEKKVKIKLPRIKGVDSDFASVNERTWQVKRGVEVEVPECVAEVFRHQEEMFEIADAFDDSVRS